MEKTAPIMLPDHYHHLRNRPGNQKRGAGGQAPDQRGLQSAARRTRAGKAALDESEYQQRQQRQPDRIKKSGNDTCMSDERCNDVRRERNQATGDVRRGDGQGAHQCSSWIRFLQAEFEAHHEVNPFSRMLRERLDDGPALFGAQSI